MNITVTDKAAKEVKRIILEQFAETQEKEKTYLRLRVLGGGCSGFQHKLDLTPETNEKTDNIFQINGVDVVVDKRSALYMDGAIVDFHDDINNRGFSVKNANSTGNCGCGASFSM